jgi:general secretion pathway protein H
MCSASALTDSRAAKAATPTLARGSNSGAGARARSAGFTLIEILVVVALVGVAAGVAALALRDPSANRLEQEAGRLAVLLEAGRAEARAAHLAARWELNGGTQPGNFRFIGLPTAPSFPNAWLNEGVSAEIVGARAVVLGPEPMIGAQRVVLRLGEQRRVVATDGMAPFTVVDAAP